ncbi:sigma-E factor regulatory protein RseB domain-containing protein [Actinomadura rayongensis]|uniref:MucB/RseB N-terminal domain-containing protein n=1 Tax=Actinomadura rayongensis TaxID=1429076 RepID=A0A6I4W4Q6_9ACTN|nr:hypothetical protein [Actinomadura rayongensis]
MRRARLRAPYGRGCALLAGGLAAAVALTGGPFGERPESRAPADDAGAVRLLRAAADAARRVPYRGRRYLTVGTARAMSNVVHTPGTGTAYGSVLSPDGVAADPPSGPVLAALLRNYTVRCGTGTRLLGRAAHLVEAHRESGRVAGRFWLDAATGLLLRRDLFDVHGRRVVESGFSRLTIGSQGPQLAARLPTGVWPDRLGPAARAALRDRGWPLPETLPGRFWLFDARRAADGAVHLGFSDGLAALSVFVQPGRLAPGSLSGWHRFGQRLFVRDDDLLHHWAITSGAGYVLTVVTEAPASTAVSVAAGLRPRGDAVGTRLNRGARRLGSWLDPLD